MATQLPSFTSGLRGVIQGFVIGASLISAKVAHGHALFLASSATPTLALVWPAKPLILPTSGQFNLTTSPLPSPIVQCLNVARRHTIYHAPTMLQTLSNPPTVATRARRPKSKLSFRAFYVTVLFISAFAVLSLVADQTARYKHGAQYGAPQRRALASLDSGRLHKRDEEVSVHIFIYLYRTILNGHNSVPPSSPGRRQMRLHQGQLSRRRSRTSLLPSTLLLRSQLGATSRIYNSHIMVGNVIHDHRHCSF